jgi:hypothetical protein
MLVGPFSNESLTQGSVHVRFWHSADHIGYAAEGQLFDPKRKFKAAMQLREVAACQLALARVDVQCPAGLHLLANFSHTADGDDELAAKAYSGGLRGDLWIDNHNFRFRKGALLPGINKIANVAA